MIPEQLFFIVSALLLVGFGMFLAWIYWKFHVLPNHYCRRRRPITYTPPIKAEDPDLRL